MPSDFPTVAIAHDMSILGGIEKMTGDVLGIETNSSNSHGLGSFANDLSEALDQHNENVFHSEKDKYKGVEDRFKGQIVDVNRPD